MPRRHSWTVWVASGALFALRPGIDVWPQRPHRAPQVSISRETRALVVAPHPDDETLAAAGLMQRVHTARRVLRVVLLADRAGEPQRGVCEDHTTAAGA